jgi:hypothetical protein
LYTETNCITAIANSIGRRYTCQEKGGQGGRGQWEEGERGLSLTRDDKVYNTFKTIADQENRPISNFIETAAMRYINEIEFVDEFETAEIDSNTALKDSMKRGIKDYKKRSGRFI